MTSLIRPAPASQVSVAPPSLNTAPVVEFRCLYTQDLRRKQKRWQDGRLKYHTFNKRVMVYDEQANYIGDSHWRHDYDLDDGDEFQLERGAFLVQVSERLGQQQQDLTELIDKRRQEKAARTAAREMRSSSAARSRGPIPLPAPPSTSSLRPKPLSEVLGTPSGHYGRAQVPHTSPFEDRQARERPAVDEPATKRPRRQEATATKAGYAQKLMGATLTLISSTPRPSTATHRRQDVDLTGRGGQGQPTLFSTSSPAEESATLPARTARHADPRPKPPTTTTTAASQLQSRTTTDHAPQAEDTAPRDGSVVQISSDQTKSQHGNTLRQHRLTPPERQPPAGDPAPIQSIGRHVQQRHDAPAHALPLQETLRGKLHRRTAKPSRRKLLCVTPPQASEPERPRNPTLLGAANGPGIEDTGSDESRRAPPSAPPPAAAAAARGAAPLHSAVSNGVDPDHPDARHRAPVCTGAPRTADSTRSSQPLKMQSGDRPSSSRSQLSTETQSPPAPPAPQSIAVEDESLRWSLTASLEMSTVDSTAQMNHLSDEPIVAAPPYSDMAGPGTAPSISTTALSGPWSREAFDLFDWRPPCASAGTPQQARRKS